MNKQITDSKPSNALDLSIATDARSQTAYEQILPLAQALDLHALLQVNLDLPTTATTCVAVARRMTQFREFFASLPGFDIANLDRLEAAGLALAVAQADYRAAVTPPDSLPELIERGSALRETLQAWGSALANGGLLSAAVTAAIRGGTSNRDLAIELMSWVRAYRGADWVKIQATSVLTDALLTEAETVAQRILAVVGYRDLNPEKIAAASLLRQRIFTVVVQRYDAVRRGATYLRWDYGDVDEFVPSLYAKGARKSDAAAKAALAAAKFPAPPAVTPAPTAPTVASPPVQEVGLPDSSPFTKN